MDEWVGRMLGKVRIESLIARGGMAEVYLGTHTTLQREVAVKILRNQYEDDPDLLERFQREARVVAKLRHQNVVQVFDYDVIDDRPYIVMEYISGPSLSKYLGVLHKNNGRLILTEVNRILNGVANALQYAHDSGVVHRDIKPGNIILTSRSKPINLGESLPEDFEPVLTDFGLVRFLNSSRQTSAGQTAGTPAYMSPEQARGETTDGRTDIYSLGIVFYEMLSGRVPFDGETTMSILLKHITDPPPPIPGLSPQVQKVLDKALAKNKEERFQKPIELARAFNAVTNMETEQSTYMGLMTVDEAAIQPGTLPMAEPVDSLIVVKPPQNPYRILWLATLGFIAVALSVVIYRAVTFPSAAGTDTATVSPIVVTTTVPISPSPSAGILDFIAILHFHDRNAIMDEAELEALAIPAPPEGYQYEVQLANAEDRVSMGILQVDSTGQGTLTYLASQKENLFELYDQVDILLKPTDANSELTERVVYSYTMPKDGLAYLREMLVSSPNLPTPSALIQALEADMQLLAQSSKEMSNALSTGNQPGITKQAEAILNILAGSQSPDHKDWNGDHQTSNLGDGFGFLPNGNSPGHIQGISLQAGYVIDSPGTNQNMTVHGGEVRVCAENINQWIIQLNEQAQKIITATSLNDMDVPVKEAAILVNKIQNGDDLNNDLISKPILGECGVATLYKSAYAMADMPLLPVNSGTPTVTSTPTYFGTYVAPTPTRGSGGGPNPPPATKKPNPTQKPKPTHKP